MTWSHLIGELRKMEVVMRYWLTLGIIYIISRKENTWVWQTKYLTKPKPKPLTQYKHNTYTYK